MRWKLVRSLFTFVLFKLHFIRNIQHQQHHWQGAFHVLPLELRIFFLINGKESLKAESQFRSCVLSRLRLKIDCITVTQQSCHYAAKKWFSFSSRLQRPRFWVKWLWNRNMADAEHWNIDLGMIWLSVMCWWKVKLEMRRQHFRLIPVQHQ